MTESGHYRLLVSNTPSVHNCVPRGSSLGPLLFILFINDIPLIINTCETHLFVDDTTLTRGGSSIYDVNPTLHETVHNLSLWASQNQTAIHPYKTKVMLLWNKEETWHNLGNPTI